MAPSSMRPPPMPEGVVLNAHAHVVLRETTLVQEPGQPMVLGCPETRHFLEVDEDFVAALAAIRRTRSLEEAEGQLLKERGIEFDLVDLARFLFDRGFIRAIDGQEVDDPRAKPKRWLIQPESLKWIHHPLTYAAVAALVLTWLVAAFLDPRIVPRFNDLHLFERPSLMLAATFTGMLVNAYVHEIAHMMMARSFGVDSRIRASFRLYFLVLQTDVTNAWALPSRQRIPIFLAGMAYNFSVVSVVGLMNFGIRHGYLDISPQFVPLLAFIGMVNLYPMVFQLFVFARTDLYYVLITVLRERNLSADARSYTQYLLRRTFAQRARAGLRPEMRCPACKAGMSRDDPFCPACGVISPRKHKLPHQFAYASRHKLIAFSILNVVGTLYAVGFITLFMGRIYGRLLGTLLTALPILVERSMFLASIEVIVILAFTLLQAAMVVYMLAALVLTPLRSSGPFLQSGIARAWAASAKGIAVPVRRAYARSLSPLPRPVPPTIAPLTEELAAYAKRTAAAVDRRLLRAPPTPNDRPPPGRPRAA